MYLIFPLFTFLFCNTTYSQQKSLLKTWLSEDLAYLKIDKKQVDFEIYGQYQYQKGYVLQGDTLRLYDNYTSSRDNFSKQHTDNFDFLIKELTTSKLILVPINSNAKNISNGKKELEYVDRKNVVDRDLRFNELRFRIYGGGWQWTDVTFLIDNQRNFKYINIKDRSKPEYYSGVLSKNDFDTFIAILRLSEIDKLYTFRQIVYDAPEKILEIDYNGKSKHIKQDVLPAITIDFVNFISGLPKKVTLSKTDPFQINF